MRALLVVLVLLVSPTAALGQSAEDADALGSPASPLPGLSEALPLADGTSPQSVISLAPTSPPVPIGAPGVRHYEDGVGDDVPWEPRLVPARPEGRTHFILAARAGLLTGAVVVPTFEGILGVENFTGVMRFRGLLVFGYEAEAGSCFEVGGFFSSCDLQGGFLILGRWAFGGDLVEWLALRVALDAGVVIGRSTGLATDARLELAFHPEDERRLELGIDGGIGARNLTAGDWLDQTFTGGVFVGGVL